MNDSAEQAVASLLCALNRYRGDATEAFSVSSYSGLARETANVRGWQIGEISLGHGMGTKRKYSSEQIAILTDGRIVYREEARHPGDLNDLDHVVRASIMVLVEQQVVLTEWRYGSAGDSVDHWTSNVAVIVDYALRANGPRSPDRDAVMDAVEMGLSRAGQKIGACLKQVISNLYPDGQVLRDDAALRAALYEIVGYREPEQPGPASTSGGVDGLRLLLGEAKRRQELNLRRCKPDSGRAEERSRLERTLAELRKGHDSTDLSRTSRSHLRSRAQRRLSRYQRLNMPYFMVVRARRAYINEKIPQVEAKLKLLERYVSPYEWEKVKRSVDGLSILLAGRDPLESIARNGTVHPRTPVKPDAKGCPACGGSNREALKSGVFLCVSQRVVGVHPGQYVGPPFGVSPPQAVWRECGNVYRDHPSSG